MKGKKFIRGHALAKFWLSSCICCFDKIFCKQRITFQKFFITPFSQFLKCENGVTYFFCQLKGSSKTSTYPSFISTLTFPTQKRKENYLVKLHHQTKPHRSQKLQKNEFSTKYKSFPKLLSIVIAKIKSNNEKWFPTLYPVHRK